MLQYLQHHYYIYIACFIFKMYHNINFNNIWYIYALFYETLQAYVIV